MQYDITLIGNYTKDTVVTPTGTKNVDGGGFNYGAHAARALGANTAAVTRLNKDDEHVVHGLVKIGVDVFPVYTAQSTHMKLVYPGNDPDQRTLIMTSSAGSFTNDQFENIDSKVFLVNASIRDEFRLETLQRLSKKESLIGIDLQGFIRTKDNENILNHDQWDQKKETLCLAHYLKADAIEAKFLTGEPDLVSAAKILGSYGPREVIITHKNGVMVYTEGRIIQEPFKIKKIVGRSGRGDTCGASYVFMRQTLGPEGATKWAAATTSLKMGSDTPIKEDLATIRDLVVQYE